MGDYGLSCKTQSQKRYSKNSVPLRFAVPFLSLPFGIYPYRNEFCRPNTQTSTLYLFKPLTPKIPISKSIWTFSQNANINPDNTIIIVKLAIFALYFINLIKQPKP